jgi:hypothetical protein
MAVANFVRRRLDRPPIPLFEKEGQGEIFESLRCASKFKKSPHSPFEKGEAGDGFAVVLASIQLDDQLCLGTVEVHHENDLWVSVDRLEIPSVVFL